MDKSHIDIYPSGENRISAPRGIRITITQTGMELLYGPGFKDKVVKSATSTKQGK